MDLAGQPRVVHLHIGVLAALADEAKLGATGGRLHVRLRLSELLDHDVVDERGNDLGVLHEVHVVQDGPQTVGLDHSLLLHGLYVGRGGIARRLGYVRGVVRGPWLLRVLLQHGRVRYVPWSRVAEVGERILVRGDGSELGPTAPGDRP